MLQVLDSSPPPPNSPIISKTARAWQQRKMRLFFSAVVTIFLGVLLPHLDLGKKGVYVMIVYCVAILAALILEISIATRKPEAEEQASYNLASQQGRLAETVRLSV